MIQDMDPMSREQFVQQVLDWIRVKFPLVKLGRGEQPFTLLLNGQNAPLENLYRLSMLDPGDMKHHVERWAVELIRASEGHPDLAGNYDDLKNRILPMVLGRAMPGLPTDVVVAQPLLETLTVSYAVDNDRTISYIPQELFQRWNMSVDDLHEVALANLVARSQNLEAHAAQDDEGGIHLIMFQTMDGYDASRILLPTLHDRLRSHLGSPFAAAIPNRDILLCFRNDEPTIENLRGKIQQDYRQMPHQISDRLFLITPDGIAPRD